MPVVSRDAKPRAVINKMNFIISSLLAVDVWFVGQSDYQE